MQQSDVCEYCGKQPLFICGQCKWVAYCSKEHQLEHWRIHKQHCNIINSYRMRRVEEETNKVRAQLRKKYFELFMHKIYDGCIKVAIEMVGLEEKHIRGTREIFNEMEYGISVCLLARSWLNVRNQAKAMIVIQSYLEEKMHFLRDMRDVINFENLRKSQKNKMAGGSESGQSQELLIKDRKQLSQSRRTSQKFSQIAISLTDPNPNPQPLQISQTLLTSHHIIKQFAIKKVSLIASVANILYILHQPVIKMYEIYTQHIEKMFGRDSFETSNCYFMLGSHFMEQGEYNKGIACFMRAAELRGNMAGDCYYNLGIIFHLQKKSQIALMMFENAAKLRENQFSENSSEVADVYHNLALINQSLGDFKSAIENLEKIALIYSKDKNSPQYKNAKQSIKALQAAFRKHMQKPLGGVGSAVMVDLKKTLRKAIKMPDDSLSQHSFVQDKDEKKDRSMGGTSGTTYMRISDSLLSKLNPLQVFYLSELQIELSKCDSIFMASSAVGSSHFLRVLKLSKLEELIRENQGLFKNVSIEKLSKRGIKDNPQLD